MLSTLSKSLSHPLLVLRGISSKATCQSPHDKKMEALVSLYHQSNTFITPENLSAVIDHAFTQPTNITEEQRQHALIELVRMKKLHKEVPRFFLGRDSSSLSYSSETMGPGWTESRSRRVDRVHRALMGTHVDGRPSWLALKENSKRVKSQMDRDSQRSDTV